MIRRMDWQRIYGQLNECKPREKQLINWWTTLISAGLGFLGGFIAYPHDEPGFDAPEMALLLLGVLGIGCGIAVYFATREERKNHGMTIDRILEDMRTTERAFYGDSPPPGA